MPGWHCLTIICKICSKLKKMLNSKNKEHKIKAIKSKLPITLFFKSTKHNTFKYSACPVPGFLGKLVPHCS